MKYQIPKKSRKIFEFCIFLTKKSTFVVRFNTKNGLKSEHCIFPVILLCKFRSIASVLYKSRSIAFLTGFCNTKIMLDFLGNIKNSIFASLQFNWLAKRIVVLRRFSISD